MKEMKPSYSNIFYKLGRPSVTLIYLFPPEVFFAPIWFAHLISVLKQYSRNISLLN